MTCNERIRACREDRDLSQREVAELLGISQRAYSDYETGSVRIPVTVLISLARFYDVSCDYLSGASSQRRPFPQF